LILVLSNVANEAASDLVGRFPRGCASLVTASDLNQSLRASISVGDFPRSELTLGGTQTTAGEIDGVVSTISFFLPQEFFYIAPADREYVCSEVSAFFVFFLSELRCRKLNPPSARRLTGLGLHRLEWMKAAAAHGVPVWPFYVRKGKTVPDGGEARLVRSTIVGQEVFGDGDPERFAGYMRLLSRVFSMPYLSGIFAARGDGDFALAELDSVPDLAVPGSLEAIAAYLGRAG
jgi:hypothetical protein